METKNGDGEDDADGMMEKMIQMVMEKMIQMVTEIEMNRWRCHKSEKIKMKVSSNFQITTVYKKTTIRFQSLIESNVSSLIILCFTWS